MPPVSPSHLIVGIHTANQYNWLLTIHWAPLACLHLIKKYSKISFVCILGNFYPRKIYLLNSMVAAWNRSASVGKDLVMWPQTRHSLKWSLATHGYNEQKRQCWSGGLTRDTAQTGRRSPGSCRWPDGDISGSARVWHQGRGLGNISWWGPYKFTFM